MSPQCTIQLHVSDAWHDVGNVSLLGDEVQGFAAKSYTGYTTEWAIEHQGKRDAHAFASRYPVSLEALTTSSWPVFLVDMLPQGFGRQELLTRLGVPSTAGVEADWRLLMAGAGNPIGNLRVKEAAVWVASRQEADTPPHGFTDLEVAQRGEEFSEYLASHGLFVAGSSGVQGEWPKILLTRADDGLLYLDHTLPDERAKQHYIVKFSRGPDLRLATIFRHEAPYMELARILGLNVFASLEMHERALFIQRFDRKVTSTGVIRFGQESIATLTEMPGFGTVPSHDEVCRQIIAHCTSPEEELLEYIKRDVANIVLGNKDNHARNTALQRDFDGYIGLTPLYDFAPMYLHPEGIARRIRWDANDDGSPDWSRVIDSVMESYEGNRSRKIRKVRRKTGMVIPPVKREVLVAGLKSMIDGLRHIAKEGTTLGTENEVLDYLRPGIEAQAANLEALR